MNERDNLDQTRQFDLQAAPERESAHTRPIELFSMDDLAGLRDEIRQAGVDTWQMAAMISSFLTQRGYGVSHEDACKQAAQSLVLCRSLDGMQAGLAALAVSM